jgi:iron(III) transport system substrate-binding protein
MRRIQSSNNAIKACSIAIALCLLLTNGGCWFSSSGPEVVVYAALDGEFSEPILNDFSKATQIEVLDNYDIESTKSVGLTNRIRLEKARPRCDVFWNNEILNTLRLEREGLLEAYLSPNAANFPAEFVSPSRHWVGIGARARVLIVNNKLVSADQRPTSVHDLADPKWKGKCGIALPLFGTTATHAAVLFSTLGEEQAKQFFADVHANAKVLSGNKQVALEVGAGQLAWGLTDTDDAIIERDNGQDVSFVFPDQAEGDSGALLIPNTICIIRGGPNPAEARRLVDHLLTPEVEDRLAVGASAQFPLGAKATKTSRATSDKTIRWMKVDYRAAADEWQTAADFVRKTFRSAPAD